MQKAIINVSDSFQKALYRRLSGLLDDAASGLLEARKKSSEFCNENDDSTVGVKSSTGLWEALFQLYPRLVGDAQTALLNRISGILVSDFQSEANRKENTSAETKELSLKLYRSCWDHLISRLKEDFGTSSIVIARLKRRYFMIIILK